jgi:hypothetical protein
MYAVEVGLSSVLAVRVSGFMARRIILHLLAYEDGTKCSETSAYKIQTPGNCPEENTQQRRQYTYNVTMKCVYATKVAVVKQEVLHILRVYL